MERNNILTYKAAAAAFEDKQYHGAKFGADDKTMVISNLRDADGIVMNNPGSEGTEIEVAHDGLAKAKLGGTVVRGQSLTTDAAGKWVTATAGQKAFAVSLASGVVNDVVTCIYGRHSVPA